MLCRRHRLAVLPLNARVVVSRAGRPDSALPLAINTFYAQGMRAHRPAHTSIDVKLSHWRKLGAFMQEMAANGLCTLSTPTKKDTSQEPSIKSIDRSAPAYIAFEEWAHTAENAAAGGGGGATLSVKTVYRATEPMKPLFLAAGAADVNRSYYDEPQVLAFLEAHAGRHADPKAAWVVDPLLADALYKGSSDAAPTSITPHEARRRFLKRLETWTRVSGGALDKPLHSRGEPPKVVLATEQRRGHHVTMVSELHVYSLDPYVAARELQGLCGATANVEEEQLKSGAVKRVVAVQGLWDRSISEWLGTRHGLPQACIANRALSKTHGQGQQKKDKKATNVRKA